MHDGRYSPVAPARTGERWLNTSHTRAEVYSFKCPSAMIPQFRSQFRGETFISYYVTVIGVGAGGGGAGV